jgi:mono/diheme cytochrome c family protein
MQPLRRPPAATIWPTAILAALIGACPARAAGDGATLFSQNCALCHQSGAVGVAGQFPRLAGRIGPLSRTPRGRAYLIDVLTYGMAGQIVVDGQQIIGVMPALALDDESAAAVLAYLQSLGKPPPKPFTAAEVAAQRAQPHKTSSEVRTERQSLETAKLLE